MKIRAVFTILVFCINFMFFNYALGAQNIKFNKLSSKTFTLYCVYYMTLFDESNRDVSEIFASLPIQVIVEQIETKYGINIDTKLFSDIANNVSRIKSYILAVRNYFAEYETEENQRVSISFSRLRQNELTVEVNLKIMEKDKVVSRTLFTTEIPY
jgi:hypothetical protein